MNGICKIKAFVFILALRWGQGFHLNIAQIHRKFMGSPFSGPSSGISTERHVVRVGFGLSESRRNSLKIDTGLCICMQIPERKVNPLKKLFIWRSPRTPVEYSSILEDIQNKTARGQPVPYVAFEQLLKKLGNSARLKYIWADMEKANYLVSQMRAAGYELDASCYRSLLLIAVEECWRGEVMKVELLDLFEEIQNSKDVEVGSCQTCLAERDQAPEHDTFCHSLSVCASLLDGAGCRWTWRCSTCCLPAWQASQARAAPPSR